MSDETEALMQMLGFRRAYHGVVQGYDWHAMCLACSWEGPVLDFRIWRRRGVYKIFCAGCSAVLQHQLFFGQWHLGEFRTP